MPNIKNALGIDMAGLAQLIRSQGRGKDTVLAHITPREAALLKANGGSGTINPVTGLPEFQEDFVYDIGFGEDVYNPPVEAADIQGATFTPEQDALFGYGANQPMDFTTFDSSGGAAPQVDFSQMDIGFGPGQFTPEVTPQDIQGMEPDQFARFVPTPSELVQTQPPSALERAGAAVKDRLGRATLEDVLRVGGIAGLGLLGAQRSRQGQQQAAGLQSDLQSMAAPYYQTGREYIQRGQEGNLLPAQQQQLQAMRAQARQQQARAGTTTGTMAAQSEAAIARQADLFRQQLIDYGFKLTGIGDQITKGAIQAGYSASQDAQNAAAKFYQAMFGMLPGVGSTQQPAPTPAPQQQPRRTV
jgi:hypothetical protein